MINPPFDESISLDGDGGCGAPAALLLARKVAVEQVEARVSALVPEYDQVKVKAPNGKEYILTEKTKGVALCNLRVGQRLSCVVTRRLPRVLSVELIG